MSSLPIRPPVLRLLMLTEQMGPNNHMLTFPVNQGKTLNIVAFHTTPDDWAEYPRLTRSGTRDEVLRDFEGYGPNVTNLLKLTDPELNVVCLARSLPTSTSSGSYR